MIPILWSIIRLIIWPAIKWFSKSVSLLAPVLLSSIKTIWNTWKSLLQPLFSYIIENWLKVLVFWVFWLIAFNLTSTLIAYVLYHLSVAIHLWIWPYVTVTTIWIIVNFILWIFFLFVWTFIFNLLKK